MLSRIHIQNFKSLKDVTLDLQQVNLLIGPNNSGKTNLLKALSFLSKVRNSGTSTEDYLQNTFNHEKVLIEMEAQAKKQIIKIQLFWNEPIGGDVKLVIKYNGLDYNKEEGRNILMSNQDLIIFSQRFHYLPLYRPNPLKFTEAQAIKSNNFIEEDASNLIPFLETLRDEYRENFAAIEADLRACVPEFHDIRFKTVDGFDSDKRTFKKWGLYSNVSEMIYWADELSEGVLYFVALLCIVHQPNPPKLLLLEEPERGIHPRRIKEVVDFIFNLAQTKDIQVIMTSHHPYILNEFEDMPEAVFVFDKDEEGATQIKNLQKDIIAPSNEENKALGLPPIQFTQDLAEHWFSGFLGGVPA